mgnify:CR=1 FL=1
MPSSCGAWSAVAAVAADLVVSGVGVTLLDTAGMRSSSDLVEQLGVERSAAAAAAADVVVMVVDAEQGWTDGDGEIFDSLWGKEGPGSRSCKVRGHALLVENKQYLAGWSVGGWAGGVDGIRKGEDCFEQALQLSCIVGLKLQGGGAVSNPCGLEQGGPCVCRQHSVAVQVVLQVYHAGTVAVL